MNICQLGQQIGKGSYGAVYLSANAGRVVKILNEYSAAEIDILSRIQSPYIIRSYKIYKEDECRIQMKIGLELEKCSGTLAGIIVPKDNLGVILEYSKIKQLFYTACLGIKALHDNNYLHLDLSQDNIMYSVTPQGLVSKIIDPGLSSGTVRSESGELEPIKTDQPRATVYIRPPECFNNPRVYSQKVDVWSLGILFLNYFSRKEPYKWYIILPREWLPPGSQFDDYETQIKTAFRIFNPENINATLSFFINPFTPKVIDLKNLLTNMLKPNLMDRYTIDDVLNHPYFQDPPLMLLPREVDTLSVPPSVFRHGFSRDMYDGLKFIDLLIEKYYMRQPTMVSLCLAYDNYMRFLSLADRDLTRIEIRGLAMIAFHLSVEVFSSRADVDHYNMRDEFPRETQYMETNDIKCIQSVNGCLRDYVFLGLCNSPVEVAFVFSNLFKSYKPELFIRYFTLDYKSYIETFRENHSPFNEHLEVSTLKSFKDLFSVHYPSFVQRNLNEGGKHRGLITMVTTANEYFPDFKIEGFVKAVDIYLYLVSTDFYDDYNTLAEVVLFMTFSGIYQNNEYIPRTLNEKQGVKELWDRVSQNKHAIRRLNTSELFTGTESQIKKFFDEYIFTYTPGVLSEWQNWAPKNIIKKYQDRGYKYTVKNFIL